jgi:hypothetical protein
MIGIQHLARAAAACIAVAAVPADARACSMPTFPSHRGGVHLVTIATADTVLAGAAGMRYKVERGKAERPVYGQVAAVERVGGDDAGRLPGGTRRVVLVPWGYDESCERTLWTSSARWVEPGMRGLLWGSLRPREQWVDGMPTVDVTEPYSLPYAPHRWRGEGPALEAEQLFELMQRFPAYDEYRANRDAFVRPVLDWARAHPELARRFPADDFVVAAESRVRHARVRRIDPPLAGTYRLTVTVDGGAPHTLYVRTGSAPASEWDPVTDPAEAGWRPPAMDDPFPGYTLPLRRSASADSLPSGWEDLSRGGFFSLAAAPEPAAETDVQVFRGNVDLYSPLHAVLGDSVLARVAREELDALNRRLRERTFPPARVRAPARFRLRPDGTVSVEQTTVLDSGTTLVIRGERISRVTIPGPDPRP